LAVDKSRQFLASALAVHQNQKSPCQRGKAKCPVAHLLLADCGFGNNSTEVIDVGLGHGIGCNHDRRCQKKQQIVCTHSCVCNVGINPECALGATSRHDQTLRLRASGGFLAK